MPNRMKILGIRFPVISMLLVTGCMLIMNSNNSEAQVSENTLESVVNQPGVEGSPQIISGNDPLYIYGDYDIPTIYVANSGSDTVTVIDSANNTAYRSLRVGISPVHIYGNPLPNDTSQDTIYVANSGSGSVSLINATTDTVNPKPVPVGISPVHVYGDLSVSDTIYVANSGSDSVSVINTTTSTVKKEIPVGVSPVHVYGDLSVSDTIYVANSGSDSVSVINTTTSTVKKEIPVGVSPVHIYGDLSVSDTIYVANSGSDSVSVINTTTSTVKKEISVGGAPVYIFGDPSFDTIYVANSGSDSVSVINTTTDTVNPKPIFVGISPVHIFGNLTSNFFGSQSVSDTIYVANSGSDSVSVINTTTSTVKKEIPVGGAPVYIFVDSFLGDIYVANSESGGVSVIDGKTNEAVAGVTFNVSPFGGGDIHCNINNKDLEAPINRFLYVSSGTKCIAKPSKGFEFISWGEILEGNSTRTINETSGSPPWSALLDTFNIKSDDPASSLTVNRFGNFTSHFRALPPAIPSEYLIPVYGIVASTVIGFSIPSIINWRKSKKQTSRLNSYHQKINSLFDNGKLDEGRLNELNKKTIDAYSEGKINNEQYLNLKNEISVTIRGDIPEETGFSKVFI